MTAPAPWRAVVLTLHPDAFPGPLGVSLAGKALAAALWRLEIVDIRAFARDKHGTVDDSPFGGGPGMVMRPDVLAAALDATCPPPGTDEARILLTPRGRPLTQERVRELTRVSVVRLVCGRYEGVDERIVEARGLEEIGVGDFVMSGGEPAAIAVIDACVRLLPGVVGATASLAEESFEHGRLEYPHYTRPQVWEGRAVPEVLLSGHHDRIRAWRSAEAERVTRERRPELLGTRAPAKDGRTEG